jgi:hypothetical protein
MESTSNGRPLHCPRCLADDLSCLTFMRQFNYTEDWFRCERCGHISCGPRQDVSRYSAISRGHRKDCREVA